MTLHRYTCHTCGNTWEDDSGDTDGCSYCWAWSDAKPVITSEPIPPNWPPRLSLAAVVGVVIWRAFV